MNASRSPNMAMQVTDITENNSTKQENGKAEVKSSPIGKIDNIVCSRKGKTNRTNVHQEFPDISGYFCRESIIK